MSRPKSWLELSDGEDDEEENQRGETTNDNTLGGLSPVRVAEVATATSPGKESNLQPPVPRIVIDAFIEGTNANDEPDSRTPFYFGKKSERPGDKEQTRDNRHSTGRPQNASSSGGATLNVAEPLPPAPPRKDGARVVPKPTGLRDYKSSNERHGTSFTSQQRHATSPQIAQIQRIPANGFLERAYSNRDDKQSLSSAAVTAPAHRAAPNAFNEETILNDPFPIKQQSLRRKDNGKARGQVRSEIDSRPRSDKSSTMETLPTVGGPSSVPANGFIEETITNDGPDSGSEDERSKDGGGKARRRGKGRPNRDRTKSIGSNEGRSSVNTISATESLPTASTSFNNSALGGPSSVPANGFIEETIANDGPDSGSEDERSKDGGGKTRRRGKGRPNRDRTKSIGSNEGRSSVSSRDPRSTAGGRSNCSKPITRVVDSSVDTQLSPNSMESRIADTKFALRLTTTPVVISPAACPAITNPTVVLQPPPGSSSPSGSVGNYFSRLSVTSPSKAGLQHQNSSAISPSQSKGTSPGKPPLHPQR